MYGMARLAEKLKIQNCINSTGNCEHYMYGLFGFAEKLNIQNCVNSTRNCRNIEYPELRKFDEKLCTLDVRIVWICRKI